MPGAVVLFSRRPDGNMSLVYADTSSSLDNRKRFLRAAGIDYRGLVCAAQVHGDGVVRVGEADRGRGALEFAGSLPQADALVTDRPGLPIAVFSADCLSVLIYDPRHPAVAAVHAGRRSTFGNIAQKTVRAMQRHFDSDPRALSVWFGSAIRVCCYRVQSDAERLHPEYLCKRGQETYVDLVRANRDQLLASGVPEANIVDPGSCTVCARDMFFSYRLEGDAAGRMISVIMIRE
ncbi:MAG: polyphenol oxidase family protein [Candidatus Omnitrophica bacterium]|nr:polyphenol oxidase family protein [Candidatus Omnitrophota bacterium]